MTHPDPLDELASAHLDGATTAEEAARVEADPDLLARVEALRAVRAALAVAPLVDDERREHAIAVALAAYDEQRRAPGAAAAGSLTPLAARRHRPSPRAWRVVGAAAAVAALAALVPLLASLSPDSSSDDSATPADARTADTNAQVPVGAAESGANTSTTGPTAPAYLPLGPFQNDDALLQAIRDITTEEIAASTSGGIVPDPTACVDELVAGLPEGVTPILVAIATVAGEATAVVVTPDEVRVAGGDCTAVRVRAR